MELNELFTTVNPSIVCFINKLERATTNQGKPLFPQIIGTGFFAHSDGIAITNRHVVAAFSRYSPKPGTNESPIGAISFYPGDQEGTWQMIVHTVLDWYGLGQFQSSGTWFGQEVPDIGFVQLGVKEVPHLQFAAEDYAIKIGMNIATVGYPMGRLPLTILGKLHQASPFIRHGIVSSVFPFPCAKPHGFTIDIMQQGGSSGSPILDPDTGRVLGIMKSSVPDVDQAYSETISVTIAYNTNISIAEPGHIIDTGLGEFLKIKRDIPPLETLADIRAKYRMESPNGEFEWETIVTEQK